VADSPARRRKARRRAARLGQHTPLIYFGDEADVHVCFLMAKLRDFLFSVSANQNDVMSIISRVDINLLDKQFILGCEWAQDELYKIKLQHVVDEARAILLTCGIFSVDDVNTALQRELKDTRNYRDAEWIADSAGRFIVKVLNRAVDGVKTIPEIEYEGRSWIPEVYADILKTNLQDFLLARHANIKMVTSIINRVDINLIDKNFNLACEWAEKKIILLALEVAFDKAKDSLLKSRLFTTEDVNAAMRNERNDLNVSTYIIDFALINFIVHKHNHLHHFV